MSAEPPPTAATLAARERLLEAGCALIVEHLRDAPGSGLRGVLKAAAVAHRAGYKSHAVLYRAWPDTDGESGDTMDRFAADVVRRMTARAHSPRNSDLLVTLRRNGMSFDAVLHLLAEFELRRLSASTPDGDDWNAWLSVVPYAPRAADRDPQEPPLDSVSLDPMLDLWRLILALWDRRMVPGLSEVHLTRALRASVDGFLVHERLSGTATAEVTWRPPGDDGTTGQWTLWSMTMHQLVLAMTEPVSASIPDPTPASAGNG